MNLEQKSLCRYKNRLLTQEQILKLHRATLNILEKTGVRVMHEEARQMLKDAGCTLKKDNIVLIPDYLVEEAIKSAPSRVTIYNQKGETAMRLEGRNVYYGMGTDLLNIYDIETGELRPSCLQDVINAAKVADYFDEIDFLGSQGFPNEVETNLAYVAEFKAQLENANKPIYYTAANEEDMTYIIEMAAAVAGGYDELRAKPFMIHYAEPISPLTHSPGAINKMFMCAENGIPLNYVPAMLSGGTGTVTLAGAIATANAESLSGLVIHQLKCKGAPMISGISVTPMDLKTGNTCYGSPDERLTHTAGTELFHYYNLPVWGEAGCSDSNALDGQAAIESSMSILMAAQDGCNLVHDVGYLGQGLIGSPASIVMVAEIISYVKRIMRGFEISDETLALDIIDKVGPGGNYLAEKHTFDHYRTEHWDPKFFNRTNPKSWAEKGSKDYFQKITEKAKQILAEYQPELLPEDIGKKLDAIYATAKEKLVGRELSA